MVFLCHNSPRRKKKMTDSLFCKGDITAVYVTIPRRKKKKWWLVCIWESDYMDLLCQDSPWRNENDGQFVLWRWHHSAVCITIPKRKEKSMVSLYIKVMTWFANVTNSEEEEWLTVCLWRCHCFYLYHHPKKKKLMVCLYLRMMTCFFYFTISLVDKWRTVCLRRWHHSVVCVSTSRKRKNDDQFVY